MSRYKPRLLADENIPRLAVEKLNEAGYDIKSLREIKRGASDKEVIELAISENRIIVTFDKDFGRIALLDPRTPGMILVRIPPLNLEYIIRKILTALDIIDDPYGKLIIIRKRTIKVINIRSGSEL